MGNSDNGRQGYTSVCLSQEREGCEGTGGGEEKGVRVGQSAESRGGEIAIQL